MVNNFSIMCYGLQPSRAAMQTYGYGVRKKSHMERQQTEISDHKAQTCHFPTRSMHN